MKLLSPRTTVDKTQQELFDSLSDVKNFEKLMPDSIAKFELIGDDAFLFGLKGMPEIKLKMKEKFPANKIVLSSASDKLPFTLTADIESEGDQKSSVALLFEGEFNAMMGMMVKGPITKFIETLSANMGKL